MTIPVLKSIIMNIKNNKIKNRAFNRRNMLRGYKTMVTLTQTINNLQLLIAIYIHNYTTKHYTLYTQSYNF